MSEGLVPDANGRQALRDLYLATKGDSWTPPGYLATNHRAWDFADTQNAEHWARWFGLTTTGGDVVALDLNSCNLVGTLPASLGNLTGLTYLNLPNCAALTGPLPASIGKLRNLTYLRTTRSGIGGAAPAGAGESDAAPIPLV